MTAVLAFSLAACGDKECDTGYELVDGECKEVVVEENEAPTFGGVDDVTVVIGTEFDKVAGVTASDKEDGALTSSITASGDVDVNAAGEYTVTYKVTDSEGKETTVTRKVTVSDSGIAKPTGLYDFKFASTELRHTLMAAAEKYLMNNMYAGVPLFASGSFNLYSSRLQLPVEEFVAVMGYGTTFATMSADDSSVLMDDGEYGNAGEYTYRTYISTNPGTFNQWLYDTSTDSTLMGDYYGAPYAYVFNADKTGYEVVAELAADDPTPTLALTDTLDATRPETKVTDTGKTVALKWTMPIADDLEWMFHPDTITDYGTELTAENADYADITAKDFYDTYLLALEEGWFRAISGGGDFINSSQSIVGANDYYLDPNATTKAALGIELDETNNAIIFTFEDYQSEWNVKYWLASFVMSPVCVELFNVLEDAGEDFGTDEMSVAYTGPYYVSYFEEDKVIRMTENENYPHDWYNFTGVSYSLIEDPEIAFAEFNAGKLEGIALPTAKFEDYKDHPGLKQVPGATTYRVMINGAGDVETLRAIFPDSTWIPEPILANQDFKMAMFFSLDRKYLAEDVLKVRTSNMYLFSNAYLVDAEKGVPYRQTDQGATVGEGLSPSTFGYNFDASQALFKKAVEAEIAAGNYTAGTANEYTVIEVEFNYFANSSSQVTMFEYIEDAFEAALVDDTNFVKVDLQGNAKDFPDIYYDYMMVGEFDLSIGGISGSTLDAASFLDTYSSDNRSGFTLNWGIDTSVPEIMVTYTDASDTEVTELWSFDAIVSALNGEIYLVGGRELPTPYASISAVDPETAKITLNRMNDDAANPTFDNFTWTLQEYDAVNDVYNDVTDAAKVDVAFGTADEVTITGLTPGGDYMAVIDFEIAADDSAQQVETYYTVLPAKITVAKDGNVFDLNSGVLDLVLNAKYDDAIIDDVVFKTAGNGSLTFTTTEVADGSDTIKVTVTGMKHASSNVIQVLDASDNVLGSFSVATGSQLDKFAAKADNESVVVTFTEAQMEDPADDKKTVRDTELTALVSVELFGYGTAATATTDYVRGTSVEVLTSAAKYTSTVDLDPNTMYEVVFTYADGSEYSDFFTTGIVAGEASYIMGSVSTIVDFTEVLDTDYYGSAVTDGPSVQYVKVEDPNGDLVSYFGSIDLEDEMYLIDGLETATEYDVTIVLNDGNEVNLTFKTR
jgi:hypothetical protein